MRLTPLERETIINFNDGEDHCQIYSCSTPVLRKLEKLSRDYPDTYELMRTTSEGAEYICPKSLIRFAKPPSQKQIEAGRLKGEKYGYKSGQLTSSDN